jgi:hypothetical protein
LGKVKDDGRGQGHAHILAASRLLIIAAATVPALSRANGPCTLQLLMSFGGI